MVHVDHIGWQAEQVVAWDLVYPPIVDSNWAQSHLELEQYREALNSARTERPIGALEEPQRLRLGIAEDARLGALVHFVDLAIP